jgi:DNA-binding HxlR family transcriptional regulator/putative sterol carrier protein
MARSYAQYCGLARALDVVGERWTLLILRELMHGGRRFSDVADALPGLSPTLLTKRLQQLEADGFIGRRRLAASAAASVYELTPDGLELMEAVLPLVRWGARRLGRRGRDEAFRTRWLMLNLQARFDPALAADEAATFELEVGEDRFALEIEKGRLRVHEIAVPGRPDATLETTPATLVAIASGALAPEAAVTRGRVRLRGRPEAIALLRRLYFAAPRPALAEASRRKPRGAARRGD